MAQTYKDPVCGMEATAELPRVSRNTKVTCITFVLSPIKKPLTKILKNIFHTKIHANQTFMAHPIFECSDRF